MTRTAAFLKRPEWHGYATGQPKDGNKDLDPLHGQPSLPGRHPSTGRNGKLGRRVERPANLTPSGPSGQHNHVQQEKLHAND